MLQPGVPQQAGRICGSKIPAYRQKKCKRPENIFGNMQFSLWRPLLLKLSWANIRLDRVTGKPAGAGPPLADMPVCVVLTIRLKLYNPAGIV